MQKRMWSVFTFAGMFVFALSLVSSTLYSQEKKAPEKEPDFYALARTAAGEGKAYLPKAVTEWLAGPVKTGPKDIKPLTAMSAEGETVALHFWSETGEDYTYPQIHTGTETKLRDPSSIDGASVLFDGTSGPQGVVFSKSAPVAVFVPWDAEKSAWGDPELLKRAELEGEKVVEGESSPRRYIAEKPGVLLLFLPKE